MRNPSLVRSPKRGEAAAIMETELDAAEIPLIMGGPARPDRRMLKQRLSRKYQICRYKMQGLYMTVFMGKTIDVQSNDNVLNRGL